MIMKRLNGKHRLWFFPLLLGGLALLVLVTMVLWNWLIPGIFQLKNINYLEAAGLLVLSRLLFGFGGHHWHRPVDFRRNILREKWETMTPEEREKFREKLRKHSHFHFGANDPFYERKEEQSKA